MACDAATVANRFIELAGDEGKALTPMQLVKLTYIAHGFSLGLYGKGLIDEAVQAWKYGPVIPSLYRRTKRYGRAPVIEPVKQRSIFRSPEELTDRDRAVIDEVYKKYGGLTGPQLSYLTHRRGTPWAQTYDPDVYGSDIDNALIEMHYATILAQ